MKIDLHVHSSERSWCGASFEQDQIKAAIKSGLDAIVITDHNLVVSPQHLKQLNKLYAPFKIFGGVEMTLTGSSDRNEDFIVLGISDRRIEQWTWSNDYIGFHKFVRANGGFIILCHPYRYDDGISLNIKDYPVDAIELYSNNIDASNRAKISELAKRRNVPVLSNSDAHITTQIGKFYNELDGNPVNESELIRCLKGNVILHY